MRDPNPTVVLIPGLGMIAWGKDKCESRVTAEFYNCAVEVMRGAEAIDRYVALPQQEAFDIEYWLLEEAKLQRMPAEKELARQVVIVIGAGSGIGKETALRLVKEGAHVVCADLNEAAAQQTAKEITDRYGVGIGVAGTGLSAVGPAIGLAVNIADRASIRRLLDDVAIAYGGFDSICVTAGIFVPSDPSGHIPDEKWAPDLRDQRHRQLPGRRRGGEDLEGAGAARQPGPHDLGQRGRRQERIARLRHLEGGGQPPDPRTGGRAGAPGARQRRRARHGRPGQRHVSPRARDRLAQQVPHSLPGRRADRFAGAETGAVSTPTAP